jgi:Secretion system C-terminal sorting domain
MKKVVLFLSVFILPCCLQAGIHLKAGKTNGLYKPGPLFSAPTDFFRSAASGFWNATATWESSPDNSTWSAATLTPTTAAQNIYIRNGHFVNINSNQDIDQVVIQSGGTLSHLGSTLTIYDDASGDDVIVESGGVFTLASASNPPLFNVPTATANINTGGILRVSTTGLTFAGVGVNANNFIYQNASVLEYTPSLAFASSGVTYFPNVNAATIPIFRTTNNLGLIGGASPTIFNGLFEAGGTITFQNAGTKTFRNGISGTGNITSDPASGKFIINGSTASLGGTGSLTLPTAGMDIGPTATVTMLSDKPVTGNIALLPNALVTLGSFNLSITGDIGGGSTTSHIVTNGTGKLIINNIAGAVPRIFPVGANNTTINPMAISNGGGFNYGVRVEIGINPAIAVPVNAVNRTWFVTPGGGTPGTVNTNFFYAAGEANAGFNYTANLELGLHTGVWNVIQTGIVPAGSYQVATTVSTFGNNIEAPLVLANLGAILAAGNTVSVNYFTGIKQSGNHLLKWKLTCNSTPVVTMVLERSTDGIRYAAVFSEYATALRCEQPFMYTDDKPARGINYYRIKMIDADGKIFYSTIVSLINAVTGIDVLHIAPNPVTGQSFDLKVSGAKIQQLEISITDMQGRSMQKNTVNLIAGFNTIPVNVARLGKGTYQLAVTTADGQTKILRFVVQ